jgi:phenol 2-monooxygenase (NADPH)
MVGADGGHSTVRQLASIPMEGDSPDAPLKWVRIDAVIKTNMPDARKGSATLESPTHGNVLYVHLFPSTAPLFQPAASTQQILDMSRP